METSTQVEPSKGGRKRTKEAKILVQDVRENVGAPSNLHKQSRSSERYIGYMALMTDLIETKPSYLEDIVKKLFWVDATVEEYESIMKNNV